MAFASLDRGKIVGRVITFRDATFRNRQEEKRQLEKKMQAVGRLTTGIAHDFNNLLFVIQGYAEQLLRCQLSRYCRREHGLDANHEGGRQWRSASPVSWFSSTP